VAQFENTNASTDDGLRREEVVEQNVPSDPTGSARADEATAIGPGGQEDEMSSSEIVTGAGVTATVETGPDATALDNTEPVAAVAPKAESNPTVASETDQGIQQLEAKQARIQERRMRLLEL
jgi:hypothetical protein